jgi:hypothetical protein
MLDLGLGVGGDPPQLPSVHMVLGGPSSSPTNSQPLTWWVDLWLRPSQTSQSFLLASEIGSKCACVPSQTKEMQFKESYWNDWNKNSYSWKWIWEGVSLALLGAALWQAQHSERKMETKSSDKLEPELDPAILKIWTFHHSINNYVSPL